MPDIGNTLREARIRRGLTITDVENVTKIRSKYLEALEENDFEVLPGPTVVKGFLRSYALYLKLDPELLLAEFRTHYEQDSGGSGVPRSDIAQQRRARPSAKRQMKRKKGAQRGYVAAGVVAVIVVILLAWLGSRGGQGPATFDASNLSTSTSAASPTTVAVQTTSTLAPSSTSSDSTSTSVVVPITTGENVTMVLKVNEGSCWLVVREDNENGAEVYAGTLSAGGQQTFNSARQYWVRAGLPESLSVSVNGTPHSLSADEGVFLVTETGIMPAQQAG